MDFLNQVYTQVSSYVRSMTPGSRIIAGLLSLVIVISLVCLCTYPLAGSKESLMGAQALSRDQLGAIQVALGEADLPYDVQGTQILIPRGGRSEYMATLRKTGVLPTQANDPIGEAIDADTIWLLPDQRKALYNNAEEKALQREILDFPGVADAKVKLKDKVESKGRRRHTVPTASVNVKMKAGKELSRELGVMICNYVAAAAGRNPQEVKVFDRIHGLSYRGTHDGNTGTVGRSDPGSKQALEQDCQNKIRQLLSFIPGVTVVVTVQPDQAGNHRAENVPSDPKNKKTTRRTTQERRDGTSADVSSTDSSATVSNQPRELPSTDHGGRGESATVAVGDLGVGGEEKKQTVTARPPVRVSVRVPGSYFEKVWRDAKARGSRPKKPDPVELRAIEAREIERVKKLAASVLPVVEGVDDRAELVTVVSFPDIPPSKNPQQAEAPSLLAGAAVYGSVLGVIVLGAAGFLVVRSMMRRVPLEAQGRRVVGIGKDQAEKRAVRSPREDLAGIELDGPLARRLIQRRPTTTEEPAPAPFGLLRKTDCSQIAQILAGELPQTIALVLSHLASKRAGRVLACFAPELQVDVVRRLVDLEQADPEVLREVEQSLETRLAEQVPMHERRVAGLEALGAILEASEQGVRRQILGNLAARDKRLATQFASHAEPETPGLSFEDLTRLDTAALGGLGEAAGEELLRLALVGAPVEITDRLLGSLAPDRAAPIRRSLDHPRPTRLSDVDAARRQLVELAQSLIATGELPSIGAARQPALSAME